MVAVIAFDWLILAGVNLVQGNLLQSFFPQVHEHYVNRQPMQPSGKSGFTAKGGDFSEKLKEGFLRQVLRFRGIAGHPQAE
jgi:hypothetical protein